MAEIATVQVSVTTTGDPGAALGSASSAALYGELLDVYVDYHTSTPATTHVTITSGNDTLLTRADTATDGLFRPMVQGHDASGAAIAGAYGRIWLNGPVTVALINSDARAAAAVVTLRVRADVALSIG